SPVARVTPAARLRRPCGGSAGQVEGGGQDDRAGRQREERHDVPEPGPHHETADRVAGQQQPHQGSGRERARDDVPEQPDLALDQQPDGHGQPDRKSPPQAEGLAAPPPRQTVALRGLRERGVGLLVVRPRWRWRGGHRDAVPAPARSARSAASTTLTSSMARVIGPTPPGFGEIHPATSATSAATSPAILPSRRATPTSRTAAPGRTMSAVTRSGTPAADTTTSARRVCAARSRVP